MSLRLPLLVTIHHQHQVFGLGEFCLYVEWLGDFQIVSLRRCSLRGEGWG
jgi:hypothetical protein